jgi:hypothetical protein
MGFRRLDTISDLATHDLDLFVRCKCGHQATLNSIALSREHFTKGQRRELTAIQRRLCCSKCRAVGAYCTPTFRTVRTEDPPQPTS